MYPTVLIVLPLANLPVIRSLATQVPDCIVAHRPSFAAYFGVSCDNFKSFVYSLNGYSYPELGQVVSCLPHLH